MAITTSFDMACSGSIMFVSRLLVSDNGNRYNTLVKRLIEVMFH
ncbi:MAG: hypothetical protein ACXW1T_10630 [Methylophilus sp.]